MHNDDPNAENMWMTPGSFWTQPEGESHITSAKGEGNIAYVEIDSGPYLVKPTDEAFDNGERPINVDASNLVWLSSRESNWIDSNSTAEISYLWKSRNEKGLQGLFIKLPSLFDGTIENHGEIFHAIVIKGAFNYELLKNELAKVLNPGSYFGASAHSIHSISNTNKEDIIIYIRTNGPITVSE